MVIEYVPIEESTFHAKCLPIVEGFAKGFATGIPELVRMEKALFVEPVEIVEMAFVFAPEDLKKECVIAHGIKLICVCRYNENQDRIWSIPFPFTFPRSLGNVLFTDLERTRDVIVGVLNRASEHGEVVRILKHYFLGVE
jgi:hypothetical protein